jgi:hypothetical protein
VVLSHHEFGWKRAVTMILPSVVGSMVYSAEILAGRLDFSLEQDGC